MAFSSNSLGAFMDDVVEAGWRGERRERLLDAASRVFARHGYAQASMDEIAAEAGIGKPTIYRYFEGKAALFTAVFEVALDRLDDALHEVMAHETTIERRLHGMIVALVPTFRDHLALRALSQDSAAIDQSKRRIFRDRRARIAEALARALAHPGATADPLHTAHLVIGMIWSGTVGLRMSDEALAAEITHLVLNGIVPRADSAQPTGNGPLPEAAERRRGIDRVRVA